MERMMEIMMNVTVNEGGEEHPDQPGRGRGDQYEHGHVET